MGNAEAEGQPEYQGWPQRFDVEDPGAEKAVVLRRTLPYHPRREWPDLDALVKRLKSWERTVKVIVTIRSAECNARSLIAKAFSPNLEVARQELDRVYSEISDMCTDMDFSEFPYDVFVDDPCVVYQELCEFVGLKYPGDMPEDIYDGNAKYMEGAE